MNFESGAFRSMPRHWRFASLGICIGLLLFNPSVARAQHDLHGPGGNVPDFIDLLGGPTVSSKQAGHWGDPATWLGGVVPGPTDVVVITHAVQFSDNGEANTVQIQDGGQLVFAPNQDSHLTVRTLLVREGGLLQVGTAAAPIAAGVTARISIKSRSGLNPFDDFDVEQWGNGILAVGGVVTMHGAPMNRTFVRTAVAPRSGAQFLELSQPVSGWRVGDEVFVPDTRHIAIFEKFDPEATQNGFFLQDERRTIAAILNGGTRIQLSSPLLYHHLGARNSDGLPASRNGVLLTPHVGNNSRNIVIRSLTADPVLSRGHALFTNRTDVNLAFVEFRNMGRTEAKPVDQLCVVEGTPVVNCNRVGRYPVHIHHLWGLENPTQDMTRITFQLNGLAVVDSLKWPIAVHATHFGLVKNTVVYGGERLTGAGIAVEEGSEFGNVFDGNFVAVVRGDVNARESGTDFPTPGSGGECFWSASFSNKFVNNVASTCRNPTQQVVAGAGFKFFVSPALLLHPTDPSNDKRARKPNFPGADLMAPGQYQLFEPREEPLMQFDGNEVYGATASAFTMWHLGTDGFNLPPVVRPESVVKNLTAWHMYESAVWLYPTDRLAIDGLFYRVDPEANSVFWEPAVQGGDYTTTEFTIRNSDIHAGGVYGNFTALGRNVLIENVVASTRDHAFGIDAPYTPGTQDEIEVDPGVTITLRNNVITPWPLRELKTIGTFARYVRTELDNWGLEQLVRCEYPTEFPDCRLRTEWPQQLGVPFNIFVENHQGVAGDNFRVYWREQETLDILGSVAPCTETRPDVDGFVCAESTPDTDPPTVQITSMPPALSNASTGAFSFISSEPNSTFQCRVDFLMEDSDPWVACTSPFTTDILADGQHKFEVRATDAAGNIGDPALFMWTIDTEAPDTALTQTPPPTSNDATPTFEFTGLNGAAGVQCSLDGAAFTLCTSPFTAPVPLAEGAHTFQARAFDEAGNIDATPASVAFTIDLTGPNVTLDEKPFAFSPESIGVFAFSSPDAAASFQCQVDGGAPLPCVSPFSTTPLADGPHAFAVRAFDATGNSGTPAQFAWTVDTTPPAIIQGTVDAVAPTADGIAVNFSPMVVDANPATLNCTPASGLTFLLGQTPVHCQAFDKAGNPGITSFYVNVTLPPGTTSEQVTVPPGGSATVRTGGNATPGQPVVVAITTSIDGTITIVEGTPSAPPANYEFLGQQFSITVPPSPGAPYTIEFSIDASLLAETDLEDLNIFRNGAAVENCTDPNAPAPNPCVAARETDMNGDAHIFVRSTNGSIWNVAAALDAPPTITNPGSQTNVEDQPITPLPIQANDPDGDDTSFTAVGLPDGLSIDADSGVISGTPTTPGAYDVIVTVTAGGQEASTPAFRWTITSAENHRPSVENPGKQHDSEGDTVSLQIVATDADNDDLTFSANGLPPGLTIDEATGLISGKLTKKGPYLVFVQVTDGDKSDVTFFLWVVDRANNAPKLKKIGDQVSEVGKKVSLDVEAHDPDHDELEFSAAGLPAGLSINSRTGLISGKPTTPGVFDVTVSVSDGNTSDSETFKWTIQAANRPPVVTSPGKQQSRRNQVIIPLQIVASDPDGDPLTYSADDLPEGLEIDRQTGLITGKIECNDPGTHKVVIKVSDGKSVTTMKFDWVILPNGRPTATNPGTQTNKVGDAVSLQLVAVDPDGDDIEWDYAGGLPAGLKLDRHTGLITGTIQSKAAIVGTHKVEVLASDGSLRHAIVFNWKVTK